MQPESPAPDVEVAEQRAYFREWLERNGAEPVTFAETHVSILALGADRVWKLKKAVRLPFVDLSTAALRRANADREVALNRRFAPDVYLGVVPLDDAGGAVLDALVEMRRMPGARRLSALAAGAGADAGACVDRIAAELVRFHRAAPTSPEIERAGAPESVAALWASNVEELRPFASVLGADTLARVAAEARRYVDGRGPLFARRIADGRVRDGHGDLLADDAFCLDDGPRFLDCLEFDDELRYGDVLADVAFLAMDLERLGRADLAAGLLDGYRALADDSWPQSLADHYVAYRALVRCKVACLSAGPDEAIETSPSVGRARALLALADAHLARARVRLVLIGGPPATGKSTLARELARRTGWRVLRSDEVRKQLAGLEPSSPAAAALDAGLYTKEWTARTYDALAAQARTFLGGGESAILDASWSDGAPRADAARVAASTVSVLSSFRLEAPAAVAGARARGRDASRSVAPDASDASDAVAAELRARFEPWPDAVALDATASPETLASRVLAGLGIAIR